MPFLITISSPFCVRLMPVTFVNFYRFLEDERAGYFYGLACPVEKLAAGNQEVAAGKRRQLFAGECVDELANA
jgi:hypothetical protein